MYNELRKNNIHQMDFNCCLVIKRNFRFEKENKQAIDNDIMSKAK